MRSHPSRADERLAEACRRRGVNVSARVIQSMKDRGSLRRPASKVEDYPKGAEKAVDALVRNGWQRNAKLATFLTFMDGYPFTAKGLRWAIGKPSGMFPDPVPTEGRSSDEIDRARERQAEMMADTVVASRHPYSVRQRKRLRSQGVDPFTIAYNLALAMSGGVPPVDVEQRYEPTTDEFVAESEPWLVRVVGLSAMSEEWERDPQHLVQDLQGFFRHLGDPTLGQNLDDALEVASEEQLAEARGSLTEFRTEVASFAGADDIPGLVGAFVFGLAATVGTLDWFGQPRNEEGASVADLGT
jgi:hypothetical protein